MSEWTRPAQPIRCAVELDKPLTVRRERWLLAQGDANANAIVAEVYQTAGKPYDLTGCTVMLTFVRPDNLALPPIEAEISGNTAIATLKDACYEVSGVYVATMQLRKDGAERTILWLIGDVRGKDIDGIVDPNHEIISVEDLMATAVEAQKAASAANAAAIRANAGADRVEQMQIDASGLAGDSNKLGGKPPKHYLHAVNLLDNSDWRVKGNIINQRGQDSYAGNVYTIDRWVLWSENGNGELRIENGRITLDPKTDPNVSIAQRFPKAFLSQDKSYTLAYARADDGAIFINNNPVIRLEYFDYISIATDRVFSVAWAVLYESIYTAENLPPFVPPDPTLELAKCQSVYLPISYDPLGTGYTTGGGGKAYILIPTPVPMRTDAKSIPSVIYDTSDFYVRCNGTDYLASSVGALAKRGDNFIIVELVNSELPPRQVVAAYKLTPGVALSTEP